MTSSKRIPPAATERAFSVFHLIRTIEPYIHPNGNVGEDIRIVPKHLGKVPAVNAEHALSRAKEIFPHISLSLSVEPYDARHESRIPAPAPARATRPAPAQRGVYSPL